MPVGILIVLVWWVVAHNSGSGWVQLLGDAVFGTVLVGSLGPAVALTRTRVRLISAPSDANAGLPVTVQLTSKARLRIRPLEPPGPDVVIGPTRRNRRGDTEVILVPVRRGLHPALRFEIASAAPFGLQWWSRCVVLALASPLHVWPRKGQSLPLPQLDIGELGDRASPVPANVGDARSVRPYKPGDQRRRVHWPSTAHAGRLMVREMEEPSARPLTLRLFLPSDEEGAERAAERALGTAVAVLDVGAQLVMATYETGGPVIAPVRSRREAGRRLARAISGGGPSRIEFSR